MALKKNITSGKKGMNRDSHMASLDKEEYSFGLNLNIGDEHGNGRIMLQNEPSNIKCSNFKSGYKVVGHKWDINSEKTYFFLTNPTTGFSEIGYIDTFQDAGDFSPVETTTGQTLSVVLETPLENTEQVWHCTYNTLITDECESGTGCLGFSIEHPFHENNILIKYGKGGNTLWFTNGHTPQRYLQLDTLAIYTQSTPDCGQEPEEVCLQCDKLRVFPLFEKPCLKPKVIQNGGGLRAGMLQVIIAGSDAKGNALTHYMAITNNIAIHDKNNNVLDQTNLGYKTNQAISISVNWQDKTFEFYKIAVLYTSGLDATLTAYEYGVFTRDTEEIIIDTLQGKRTLDLTNDLLQRRPYYETAEGIASVAGHLIQYGLKEQRTPNLQQVINLLGSHMRWASYVAKEGLYEDGVAVANYQSYLRGEGYAAGIKFIKTGGQELPIFPFVARPPKASEIEVPEDLPITLESIEDLNQSCQGIARQFRWQFENTAELEDTCFDQEGSGTITTVTGTSTCVALTKDGTTTLVTLDGVIIWEGISEIGSWINNNLNFILTSSDPALAEIKDYLLSWTEFEASCEPEFPCAQLTPPLTEEFMFVTGVDDQEAIVVPQELEDYTPSLPPTANTGYLLDALNQPIPDTTFAANYLNIGEVVYTRALNANTSCALATSTSIFFDPQLDNTNHFNYKGENATIGTLITAKAAVKTRMKMQLAFTGASGTATVAIGGFSATMTYSGSLISTVSTFTTANAASILSSTGLTATAIGTQIFLTGDYVSFITPTITNLTGTLQGSWEEEVFTDRLHTNVIWFKVDMSAGQRIFEMGTPNCQLPEAISSNSVRLSVYTSCVAAVDLSIYSRIVDNISTVGGTDKLIDLDPLVFTGGFAYIAIDTPIKSRKIGATIKNVLTTTCGDFPVYQRETVLKNGVSFVGLKFAKKQVYTYTCEKVVPNLAGCIAVPYQKGLFGYTESTALYPCNKELYDSSDLIIRPEDIPVDYQQEFEDNFTTGVDINGYYILNSDTDLRDKPIRHYKFPDSNVSPFMTTEDQILGDFAKAHIYPIGFNISNELINAYLDIAVNNNLLTQEERDSIVSYEIYVGNRSTQKSIVAKGIVTDMYQYLETNQGSSEVIYYPNYPLNAFGTDWHNQVDHPYGNGQNNFFTFLSPDTCFEKPSLTTEVDFEGFLFGKSINFFDEINEHPTYVLLKQGAYNLASAIALAEVAFELAVKGGELLTAGAAGGLSAPVSIAAAVVATVGIGLASVYRIGEYRYEWMETIKNLGTPYNFAYMQSSEGYYGYFKGNPNKDQRLRGLAFNSYLRDGRWELANERTGTKLSVNNQDREESVAFHTGSQFIMYPTVFSNHDNSTLARDTSSRPMWEGIGKSPGIIGNTAMAYATLKDYLPAQYGTIDSIDWLPTGYCGNLLEGNECEAIFGGDTFITRFAVKKKVPFFTTNAMRQAPLTPFAYSDYFNINPEAVPTTRTYLDYEINKDANNFGALLFPANKSDYILAGPEDTSSLYYIKPTQKFFVFSYGVPHFLVESSINTDFRYAGREPHEDFYPRVGSHINWNQEANVSIRKPNTFFYNSVYSTTRQRVPYSTLPTNYQESLFVKLRELKNTVIYSRQDVSENSIYEPWLQYQALDSHTFSKQLGELRSIITIESQQLLVRFENGYLVLNPLTNNDGQNDITTYSLGNGALFRGRPVEYNSSVLGYAGTQNHTAKNTEFGTFWADAKRGKIFQLLPNGRESREISRSTKEFNAGLEKWFKAQLPFKILKYFPEVDVDNNYNGFGITMGWDDRTKRLFITKKDYIPKEGVNYHERIGFYTGALAVNCPEGYELDDNGNCVSRDTKLTVAPTYAAEKVSLHDTRYFEEASWTLAYNPVIESWISYYSFLPNYYIGYNDYFKTGINQLGQPTLWTHLPFISSYQVFYGALYPAIIELPLISSLTNSILHYIEYYLDVRKYYNQHNFSNAYGVGFNKAYIYNEYQNTGLLELIHQKEDNMAVISAYPKHNPNSISVLQTEINSIWAMNYLYNSIRNEKSGLPVWLSDNIDVLKTTDDRLLNYNPVLKDYLRGEYFLLRLINDTESRFKFLFRLSLDERDYYDK